MLFVEAQQGTHVAKLAVRAEPTPGIGNMLHEIQRIVTCAWTAFVGKSGLPFVLTTLKRLSVPRFRPTA